MPALRGVRRRVDAVRCAGDDGGRTDGPGRRTHVARRRDREHPRLLPRLQLRRRQPGADAQRRRRLVRDEQRRPPDDDQGRVRPAAAATAGRHPPGLSGPMRARPGRPHRRGSVAGVRDLCAAAGVAGARPADDRDQRELLRRARPEGRVVARHQMQLAARRLRRQHPRAGPRQRRRHRHRRLRGQAGPVRRRRELVVAGHDDPADRRRAIRRHAEGAQTTTTRRHR